MKPRNSLLLLAGAAVALVIAAIVMLAVGDDTATAPTQTEKPTASPTAEPTAAPNFEYSDVLTLTEQWVSENVPFPQETDIASCASAGFREVTRMWLVTCDFFAERDLPQSTGPYEPQASRTYLFDDTTGDVRLP